jgi:N-acetylglutamate synthase-like GNAT family acetyltransferase
VAEAEGVIVGCAALEVYSRKIAEVRSLAVDHHWSGQDIGSKLVHACIKRARSRGVAEVMAITSAEKFFEKQGFSFALPHEKKALFYWTK